MYDVLFIQEVGGKDGGAGRRPVNPVPITNSIKSGNQIKVVTQR